MIYMAFIDEFEKIAASVLRRAIKVVPSSRGYKMLHNDKVIGEAVMSTTGTIKGISIIPEFQGKGLSRKFYGEIARMQPGGVLKSDSLVSPQAVRSYVSINKRRPGSVKQSPYVRYRKDYMDDDFLTEGMGASYSRGVMRRKTGKGLGAEGLSDFHPNKSVFRMEMPPKSIRPGVPKKESIKLEPNDPKVTWNKLNVPSM